MIWQTVIPHYRKVPIYVATVNTEVRARGPGEYVYLCVYFKAEYESGMPWSLIHGLPPINNTQIQTCHARIYG